MGDHKVAAGRHRVQQPADDGARLVVVGDEVQDPEKHDGDRSVEVEGASGVVEDFIRLLKIGIDVVGGALWATDQQCARVGEDQRIVVDVHDARFWRDTLGDLMGVVGGRQTGTYVEELPYLGLAGQV